MLRFFSRRAGVLALASLAFMVGGLFVWQALFDVLDRNTLFWMLTATLGLGIVSFFAFAGTFLFKSLFVAGEGTVLSRMSALSWLVGASVIAVLFWQMVIAIAHALGIGPHDLTAEQVLVYVIEQTLSGMLLDIMEVYDIRISDVTYDPHDYAFATLVLGMRLTGSFVVAALLVKVFSRK